MKLAVITPFPPMKMAEADHGLRLCQHLAEANVDVHVLTTVGSVSVSSPRLSIAPIMRKWSWREWPRLKRFLNTVSPNGVLLFYYGPIYHDHPMITFAPTLMKKLSPQTPFVTQVSYPGGAQTWQAPSMTRLTRKFAETWAGKGVDYSYGTLLRDSDRIIVFSDSHRNTLAESSPLVNQKSVLIPPPPFLRMASEANGLYRQRVNDRFQIGPNEFLLEYFGYIYRGKGIETLLQAFRIALQRKPHLRLLIVGGVPNDVPSKGRYVEDLKRLGMDLGLDDRVGWTGDYPWDSDIGSSYLRAADLCVLPFDRGVYLNNSSFSAAAAHSLPILSTREDLVEPAFVHGENVLLCPPKDPPAMAAAIERLVDDIGLRQRLRDGVRRMAQEWFTWDRVVERTLAAFGTGGARAATTQSSAGSNRLVLWGKH